MTPQERRAFLEYLPYIKRLEIYVQCDGYRPMSRKSKLDSVQREHYRCKKPAYWKFTALKNSYGESGIYCMDHLMSRGLITSYDEQARTNKYWEKYKKEVLGDT